MRRDTPPSAARLLAWYDANARDLPWRAPPGAAAMDPYRVWLSEVMLQQTTVAAVRPRFEAWVARWPTVDALAAAGEADVLAAWAGLGYYARAQNLVAAARAVVARGGFPRDEAGLRALPGLGEYTAAAVAAIAFGAATMPVDANIARVGARLFADDLPAAALRARMAARFGGARPGDLAQALMDLGSSICTPRVPVCLACPLAPDCAAFASGDPSRWPARKARVERPVRRGIAFWLEADGHVLLVRRPPRGLLGGMLGLPTSGWGEGLLDAVAVADAPVVAGWRMLGARIAHVFTHFRLDLGVAVARLAERPEVGGEWVPVAELARAGMPTVFARAADLAQNESRTPFPLRAGLGWGAPASVSRSNAQHGTPIRPSPQGGGL